MASGLRRPVNAIQHIVVPSSPPPGTPAKGAVGSSSPLRGGPLRTVSRFLEDGSSAPDAQADVGVEHVLAACARLHALLEREQSRGGAAAVRGSAASRATEELEALVLRLFPGYTLGQLLLGTHAGAIFPLLQPITRATSAASAADMTLAAPPAAEVEAPVHKALAATAGVARACSLVRSLLAEMRAERHKYAAHQLALVYQALKAAKLAEAAQREIEGRFEECKTRLDVEGKADAEAMLPDEYARWLVGLLERVEGELEQAFPVAMPALEPVIGCMRTMHAMHAQIGGIVIGVYAAGKSAGHIEVLQDPDGMRKQLVESYVMRSYSPGDKGGESGDTHHSPPPVVIYDARNSLYRRVSSIGARVLAAARDHVQAQSAELARRIAQLERDLEAAASTGAGSALERTVVVGSNESRATSSDEAWRQLVVAKEEAAYWQEAAKRLSGQWQWVVTNSLAVNAFVTPYCPRCVFVLEGLLRKFEPSDDELAMVIAHELAHHLHAHGARALEFTVESALLQLLVLSLVDPTGLLELGLSAAMQAGAFASKRQFDRECESEADETGLQIVTRACFDPVAAAGMMGKFAEVDPERSNDWLSTHPLPATRLKRLLSQGGRLEADPQSREHCEREQRDLRKAFQALTRGHRRAPPPVAPAEAGDVG